VGGVGELGRERAGFDDRHPYAGRGNSAASASLSSSTAAFEAE
jgi:hypothetical protein